jgi:hypothetical protein
LIPVLVQTFYLLSSGCHCHVLESYLVTPRRKEKLAFWLVYFPLAIRQSLIYGSDRHFQEPRTFQHIQMLSTVVAPNFDFKPDIVTELLFSGMQTNSVGCDSINSIYLRRFCNQFWIF